MNRLRLRAAPYVSRWLLIVASVLIHASTALGRLRQFHTDYRVEVDPHTALFHVTATVGNLHQGRLDLSLPVWTPGWYEVENYAKNVLRFRISDAEGRPLPHRRTHTQTWSVETAGHRQIRVEFDYRADTLMANQAWITNDFAFFTGTQLFLMAEGHRDSPSTVHFRVPAGWKIISALTETADPLTFTAADYDTLVDAPTEMGSCAVTRFELEGKPHYFTATPAASLSPRGTRDFVAMLKQIAATQSAIFGGLPYRKYVYFYFFWPPGAFRQGYLEHANSQVVFGPPAELVEPDLGKLAETAAHEFFHLWNVKRIRPIEMWPYDYTREHETPLLWVSEGLSDYYASLTCYRAGLIGRSNFLDEAAASIREAQQVPAADRMSPADSSIATWLDYGSSQDQYYAQGRNFGALLDLSIRRDSGGKAGLDDVMRGLDRNFYRRGRGFSTEDLLGVIQRLARRDYHDFFRRCVWGTQAPDYDAIYGYAGLRVETRRRQVVFPGFAGRFEGGNFCTTDVTAGSNAAQAGLRIGDVIHRIDGQPPDAPPVVAKLRSNAMIGKTIRLDVLRAGANRELSVTIGFREIEDWRLVEAPAPTPAQLRLRETWLSRSAPR